MTGTWRSGATGQAAAAARPPVVGADGLEPLDAAALAFARELFDEAYEIAVEATNDCPGDFRSAARRYLSGLFALRERRLAYFALAGARRRSPHFRGALAQARERQHHRMVEVWAPYLERAKGLDRADALGLAAFLYESMRGLSAQVDAGLLAAEAAVAWSVDVLTAAVERLEASRGRKKTTVGGG
jgi:hypothetical protein